MPLVKTNSAQGEAGAGYAYIFMAMATSRNTRKDPPKEMLGLGTRLKKAMKLRKINGAELARVSDTTPDQITRARSGETLVGIEAQTVAKWSKALRVRLDWLVMNRDPMELDDTVPLFNDGSDGVDRAIDVMIGRMEERGLAVKVHGASANKNRHD
jgi:transcriptional regulator with XRE-family HTH domain